MPRDSGRRGKQTPALEKTSASFRGRICFFGGGGGWLVCGGGFFVEKAGGSWDSPGAEGERRFLVVRDTLWEGRVATL